MSDWIRVNKHARCTVCASDSWCTFLPAKNIACCMRVQSQRPAAKGNGWIHKLDGVYNKEVICQYQKKQATGTIASSADLGKMAGLCSLSGRVGELSSILGLTMQSLRRMQCGWSESHQAWTFPMRNEVGQVVGIRLRLKDGRKISVKGGHEGLFVPDECDLPEFISNLFVAEGPTDTSALLQMGVLAVGRPSCLGAVDMLLVLLKKLGRFPVIIFADADRPGWDGALRLASQIKDRPVKLLRPPGGFKDVREWLKAGATLAALGALVRATAWMRD